MATRIKQATGADVRAWATENGVEVGKRGRFSADVQKAFNDSNKGVMKYTPGNVETIDLKVTVTSGSGKTRKEFRPFSKSEVRALAAQTLDVPAKGPLSKAALEAAAANYKG